MTYMRKSFSLLIMILIVSNFAVANVTVSIGDVQVDGYTDDIVVPVTPVSYTHLRAHET